MRASQNNPTRSSRGTTIRVGYIPLLDAAPLLIAQEKGFFKKYGVSVRLSQEAGWATIRDKIIFGELDAAHSLGCLPFVTSCGLGCVRYPTVCSFIFNLHGDAITLSNELWKQGVRDLVTLRDLIREIYPRKLTFGVVFPYSSHAYLLRKWLKSGGINPDLEVQLAIVPPPQMFSNLRSGNLDGYCVGEPWNSLAIESRVGWCPMISAKLDPSHPEKVLMVRSSFVHQRNEEHLALLAGLIDAALYCDNPRNREELIAILSQKQFIDVTPRVLQNALNGQFSSGHGVHVDCDEFILFHRYHANEPSVDKAERIFNQIKDCGVALPASLMNSSTTADLISQLFRPDLYQKALEFNHHPKNTHEISIAPRQTVHA